MCWKGLGLFARDSFFFPGIDSVLSGGRSNVAVSYNKLIHVVFQTLYVQYASSMQVVYMQ